MIATPRPRQCLGLAAMLAACAAAAATPVPAMASDARAAESSPILLGERFVLHSKVLNEDREILVHLPKRYDRSKQRYPVLVLLDGENHLLHASGVVDVLAADHRIPDMIVVAVPSLQRRMRDLTAPVVHDAKWREGHKGLPVGGGGAFLKFLADEMMPWIDGRYRTEPYRILMGHSLGGLFNMIALLERPDAFQAHISASPSLWWDDEAYVKLAEERLGAIKPPHFLFLSWGDNERVIAASGTKLIDWLGASPPPGLIWRHRYYPGDMHGTTPHRSLYDGLSDLFEGWSPDMNLNDPARSDYVADKPYPELLAAHQIARARKFGYAVPPQPAETDTLVRWFARQKRYDEALAAARRNFALYPEYRETADRVGQMLAALGRPAEALPFLEKAIGQSGEYDDAWTDQRQLEKLREEAAREPPALRR